MYAYVYAVSMHGSMCTECIVSLRTAPVKVEDACSEERVPLLRELLTSLMWRCISNFTTKLVRYSRCCACSNVYTGAFDISCTWACIMGVSSIALSCMPNI